MPSGFEGYVPPQMPVLPRWLTMIGKGVPQPGIVPLPPQQFRPQAPPPTINRMPGIESTPPTPPPNYFEVPGGFDPSQQVPGRMTYGGPQLNNEAALAGLRGSSPSPLLDIQRTAGGFTSGGGAYRGGLDEKAAAPFQEFVSGQLAPQRAMTGAAETALGAQHPAIRSLAATSAQQKAMPAMATAAGMTGAADITAEATLQKAMLDSMTGQRQEAAEAIPAFTNLLESLFNRENFDFADLDPQMQSLILQSLKGLGGVYSKAGF